jgi:hypothetical protein
VTARLGLTVGDCSFDDKGVFGVLEVTRGTFVADEPGRRELPSRRSVVDDDETD